VLRDGAGGVLGELRGEVDDLLTEVEELRRKGVLRAI
jgi:hypothetical protein